MAKEEKMPRLIDADKLIQDLNDHNIPFNADINEAIIVAPTVDAEPVHHGRWKRSKFYENIIFCDECGEPFELSNGIEHWNYCPNCGARMDEVEE